VWGWRGDYGEHIVCGLPWFLELRHDGSHMSCKGNCFEEDAPPGCKELFIALNRLVGRTIIPEKFLVREEE
jgi:hypothetical protein